MNDENIVNSTQSEQPSDVAIQPVSSPENVPGSEHHTNALAQVPQPDSHVKTESSPTEEEKEKADKPATLLDVYEALDNLSTPGSTCTGGVASILPVLPGLTIEGVGSVHLPLTKECVEKIKLVARQAPFGRGTETVVDTAVRNTLQVDADKVSFQNPAWHTALTKLTGDAVTALGVNAYLVQPQLYKLLLYEQGGFFKKHRDTEKEDGMFATLVVQLASSFTGGAFVVSHKNQSRTFCLDDPATAPYQCHYVAHYADCQHEILPVESGVRVALIYSLCYTGTETTKPCLDNLSERSLVSVMNRLDKSDSLFAIPLDHQYTTASLARLGVGALKGWDRNLAKAISVGAPDGWEMVLVKVERTDTEIGKGEDGDDDLVEVDECEKGDPRIILMFHKDGRDASAHMGWMNRQLNFDSCENDGMILASEDRCEEMWGDGNPAKVEDTGNEGATRDTTYSAYLLVVFSNHGVFERLGRSSFHDAVDVIMMQPEKHLDAALAYMDKALPPLSSDNFVKLYELVCSAYTDEESSYWNSLEILVLCLEAQRVPSAAVAAILASLVKQNGWSTKTVCIRIFLERLPDLGKTGTCTTILGLVDTILVITSSTQEDSTLDSLLDKTLANFEKATEKVQLSSSGWYHYTNPQDLRPADLCQKITLVANKHTWNRITKLVKPCFARIRELQKYSVDHLAEELLAVRNLAPHLPASLTKDLRHAMLGDFITLVKNAWNYSKIDVIVVELFSHGTPFMFHFIEKWASGAAAGDLEKADLVFQKIDSQHITSEHSAAKDQCVKFINTRSKELAVIALQKQLKELEQATQGGMPVFSWSIPNASTGHAAIDAFLSSSNEGPMEVTVGGGINNAKRHAKKHRFYEITSTPKIGESASVIVKKTGKWYHDKVQEYQTNMKKISDIQVKLRGHAATPSELPTDQCRAKRSRADDNVIGID